MAESWWMRRGPAIAVSVATVAAGVGQLLASVAIQESRAWLSQVLVNTGTETLLLVPLLLLAQWYGKSFVHLRDETRQESQLLRDEIGDVRANVTDLLHQMSTRVAERLNEPARRHMASFKALEAEPERSRLIHALHVATEAGLISKRGLCVDLPHADLLVRWQAGFAPSLMLCEATLAAWDKLHNFTVAYVTWDEVMSTEDLLVQLGRVVQREGRYPGDALFHPADMFRIISDVLSWALRRRSGIDGVPNPLPPIVYASQQWAITDGGIATLDGVRDYRIELGRLRKMDWDAHMRGKQWVDIADFRRVFDLATVMLLRGIISE